MIAEGRVAVNGRVIDSPALNVTEADRIAVDGKAIAEAERARLWLYHKPAGLVTSASDEKRWCSQWPEPSFAEPRPRTRPIG